MIDLSAKLRILHGVAAAENAIAPARTGETEIAVASFRFRSTAKQVAYALAEKDISAKVGSNGRNWTGEVNYASIDGANTALTELRRSVPKLFLESSWHYSGLIMAVLTSPVTLSLALLNPTSVGIQLAISFAMIFYLWGTLRDLQRRQLELYGRDRVTITSLLLFTALIAAIMSIVVASRNVVPWH